MGILGTTATPEFPYQISTVYPAEELSELSIIGSADLVYICSGIRPPQILSRYANNNWTFSQYIFDYGPFNTINTDDSLTVYLTGTLEAGESVVVTSSEPMFADLGSVSEVVGRLFLVRVPGTNLTDGGYALVRITQYNTTTMSMEKC